MRKKTNFLRAMHEADLRADRNNGFVERAHTLAILSTLTRRGTSFSDPSLAIHFVPNMDIKDLAPLVERVTVRFPNPAGSALTLVATAPGVSASRTAGWYAFEIPASDARDGARLGVLREGPPGGKEYVIELSGGEAALTPLAPVEPAPDPGPLWYDDELVPPITRYPWK